MDLNKSLRLAIDTGKVSVGSKQSCKAINSGSAKLIILASNCPKEKGCEDQPKGGKKVSWLNEIKQEILTELN